LTNFSITCYFASSSSSDGAVNAPSWVVPVGAGLAILTAAVPVLLRPGEEALEQQRIDEQTEKTSRRK